MNGAPSAPSAQRWACSVPSPAPASPPRPALPALQPGVWFPEERGALSDRRALLGMASEGCTRFLLNRTPWQLETDPIQLGMGLYL